MRDNYLTFCSRLHISTFLLHFVSRKQKEEERRNPEGEKKNMLSNKSLLLSFSFLFFSHFFVSPEMQLVWCKILQCCFWFNKPYFSTCKPDYAQFWHVQMSLIMFFSRKPSSVKSTVQEKSSSLFHSRLPLNVLKLLNWLMLFLFCFLLYFGATSWSNEFLNNHRSMKTLHYVPN